MMEWGLRILLIGLFAYGALVVAAYLYQRSLLYFPDKALPRLDTIGVGDMSEVKLQTADGLSLTAWYKGPAADLPVIVLFHGNAGSIANRAFKARAWIDTGYGVLLVEYRGYGGNPGSPSETGLYDDGRAAIQFLRGSGIEPQRMVIYGESLGTGVAVQIAAELPIAAVILEAPFSSAVDVAAHHYPFLPVRWLMKDRFDNLDKLTRIKAPLMVLHGGRDQVIPTGMGRAVFGAAEEPKVLKVLPQAGHNDLYDFDALQPVLNFLRWQARPGRRGTG